MKRPGISSLVLLLTVLAAAQTNPTPQGRPSPSIDDALAAAKARGKLLLVHFTSPG